MAADAIKAACIVDIEFRSVDILQQSCIVARMAVRELQTAGEVIDALGGTAATARLTGRKDQHVSNWRAAGRLPADTFLIISEELRAREYAAPPRIWGIREPERAS